MTLYSLHVGVHILITIRYNKADFKRKAMWKLITLWGWAEKFIGWLWCNGQLWPNVVYFSTKVSPAVHTLPSALQRLDSFGIESLILILILEKSPQLQIWPHHRSDTASQPSGVFFILGSRKYSEGAKSGEYGGWSTSSMSQSHTSAITTTDLCTGAWSWWHRTPFVSFPGHFDLITFRRCLSKLAKYSPLIVWPFRR